MTVTVEMIEINGTLVHIEDYFDFQEEVKETIKERARIRFNNYLPISSVAEARTQLGSIKEPLILLLDLFTEDHGDRYAGGHFLAGELREVLKSNPNVAVFVISGYLDGSIVKSVIDWGIPKSRIFDKGRWGVQLDTFASTIRNIALNMDAVAQENVLRGLSGTNLDPYLLQMIETHSAKPSINVGGNSIRNPRADLLPMLIRTNTKGWQYGRIPDLVVLDQLGTIYSCLGSVRTLTALAQDLNVISVEASRPSIGIECYSSVPYIGATDIHISLGERGANALIGIIDTGIDIFHETLRDPSTGKTRFLAIWDQRDPTGPPPANQKVGTEHTEIDLNRYLASGKLPFGLSTTDKEHGTHVVSIAAGRATTNFTGGVAPEAKLVFVIPDMGVAPEGQENLGYHLSHSLALNYIRDLANRINLPVVINLSHGTDRGGHDGRSNIEIALEEVTNNGDAPGIVIVKSAGNSRKDQRHARIVMDPNQRRTLEWATTKDHQGPDVIELWYRADEVYSFRLVDPNENVSRLINTNNPIDGGLLLSGNRYDIYLKEPFPGNQDNCLLIIIKAGIVSSIAGNMWSLEIYSGEQAHGELHAWIGRTHNQAVQFLNYQDEAITLSIPATAKNIITVGSVSIKPPHSGELSEFSALGGTRDGRNKPDLVAPGEAIEAAHAGSVGGVRIMSGTSMAAPHVAGAIALKLSRQAQMPGVPSLNSKQVHDMLINSCTDFDQGWDSGYGYGTLDVKTFVQGRDPSQRPKKVRKST